MRSDLFFQANSRQYCSGDLSDEQCVLLRLSAKICKSIIAFTKTKKNALDNQPMEYEQAIAGVDLCLIASLGRESLSTSCGITMAQGSKRTAWSELSVDERRDRLRVVSWLIETEVLPQASRWHRRDLVPAAEAVWRAVLRGLARLLSSCADPAGQTGV
eukprot:CAMPEP_0113672390 /NCGR_PEP_ID=MMETSP0038_2-20120614/6241_1 /TAXON_ID=2898 /ORGANISM="Cryptomonas paramecium" /LENGTH=158 /DNA_ID=CAMNT_0000588663 /DNA_START=287 /DNA_END=763 /DNA_ORIENTATION=+ /assembly_acc=CAM_ASM_000170